MKFVSTDLDGPMVVESTRSEDTRGYFARTFAQEEFAAAGIDFSPLQTSVSYNHRRFTLRGLHFQQAPHAEAKLVRCTRGSVFDVAVDVREGSPTYGKWTAIELSAEKLNAFFIPEGFAHGFETLEDHSEVHYMISAPFEPSAARGIRWDDPTLQVGWPAAPQVISDRDATYPDFKWRRAASEEGR